MPVFPRKYVDTSINGDWTMQPAEKNRYTLPTPENRASPRKQLAIEVLLQFSGGSPFQSWLRDLSVSGFSASTPVRIPTSTICVLSLTARTPIEARVVWCDAGLVGCAFDTPISGVTYDAVLERWEAEKKNR
jgi:hypothetical protein